MGRCDEVAAVKFQFFVRTVSTQSIKKKRTKHFTTDIRACKISREFSARKIANSAQGARARASGLEARGGGCAKSRVVAPRSNDKHRRPAARVR